MFYLDHDPFLKYRPFPDETDNLLLQHWHEIAGATIFYFVVMWTAPIINKLVFGSYYTDMKDPKKKLNFDIHFTALVQSIIAVMLSIPMFGHPYFREDPIFGTYDFAGMVAAFTCGYFVWDLLYCCIYRYDLSGFQYLFHGFGALVVFMSTFKGFCQPLIPAFLIFELSTPFVNLHWFYTRGPKGFVSNNVFLLNGLLLISTFFMSRCVWGVYASIKAFKLCMSVRDQLPSLIIPVVFTLNLGFHALNFYWFNKMIKLATRQITGNTKKHN